MKKLLNTMLVEGLFFIFIFYLIWFVKGKTSFKSGVIGFKCKEKKTLFFIIKK